MKYLIILLLSSEPIYIPFNELLSGAEQGNEAIEIIGEYHPAEGKRSQGWYTKDTKLIYGFYCE